MLLNQMLAELLSASAKDDAAGQAIANRMTAQINGLAQAQRNANDGISVAQTAEGGLNQVNDNLQRIRELSVQAANGTNSANDLQSIQDEVNQRLDEIDRISAETDFNGTRVLSENAETLTIQVGSQDGQTIDVNLSAMNRGTLELDGFSVVSAPEATADDLFAATAVGDTVTVATVEYTLNADGWLADGDTAGNEITEDALRAIIDDPDGADGAFTASIDTVAYAVDTEGAVTSDTDTVYLENDALTTEPEVLATENPMAALDAALNQVDSLRSELGAVQNRFEDAINNLSTNETNLAAARSRIEDADYAVEVANMTRAQILQQAGTSVLAQANQVPQNVLSLLG
ncbi:FliC/FljB family flagellin [Halomonas sp. DQ26W]|uniref:FliC/FljB family flagellin n=1 Tax=Halomonas sp. DQ26W TaxID=2282311 RepID=UPI000DF737A0|nr:FliC/FljB family flagellin [Halomonas sp. DQ26W]RDB42737.1 FliC/FljB family flagellin [Halomonas sp. DQ26W]